MRKPLSSSDIFFSMQKKAVVIRHLYNEDGVNIPEDTISTVTDVSGTFDVCDLKTTEIKIPEVKFPEIKSEQQDIKINPEITALQTMLAQCQEKLQKLTLVESRLDSLEEKMKGRVMNNEYIDFSETNEDYESSNDMDILNPDRKSKEERQTSIPLSSGYSTVSSDSTPRTSTGSYCGLKENSEETTIQKMERMKKMFEETAELLKCPNHQL
uniref:centrosomal protein of 44 kDa isoform X2 n=1 Tax=Halichoerus grypus TaxID=9711 RepID=UPI001658F56D|nr:centrosomal protein of 44 kDa isoform X2 [Halichoerus grypus]